MPTWDDVRRIALALPDVEDTTTYGQPCFKVNGRPFVNTGRVEGAIVTRAPDEERDLLISRTARRVLRHTALRRLGGGARPARGRRRGRARGQARGLLRVHPRQAEAAEALDATRRRRGSCAGSSRAPPCSRPEAAVRGEHVRRASGARRRSSGRVPAVLVALNEEELDHRAVEHERALPGEALPGRASRARAVRRPRPSPPPGRAGRGLRARAAGSARAAPHPSPRRPTSRSPRPRNIV